MNLKEFTKQALTEIINGVEETRTMSSRDLRLTGTKENRTVEFDVAVTVETKKKTEGETEIKVLAFAAAGGHIGQETTNSTITRIKFGVNVDPLTKTEEIQANAQYEKSMAAYNSQY